MTHPMVKNLKSMFKPIAVKQQDERRIMLNVPKDSLMSVLIFLKNSGYAHLGLISCVDRIADNKFELVYIVSAYVEEDVDDSMKATFVVSTFVSRKDPRFITCIPVFINAEPYERELHELYGIVFEGHPRLTPLLLEREYPIPPMRKDFDSRAYVEEVFDTVPFVDQEDDS